MEKEKYLKDVLKAFDAEIKGIKNAKNPGDISYHERKAYPLLVELGLAVPMLEQDITALSRKRRRELSEGE